MPITYHKEEVEFQLPDEDKLSAWLESISAFRTKSYFSDFLCVLSVMTIF